MFYKIEVTNMDNFIATYDVLKPKIKGVQFGNIWKLGIDSYAHRLACLEFGTDNIKKIQIFWYKPPTVDTRIPISINLYEWFGY
jgi:hypothetical protein